MWRKNGSRRKGRGGAPVSNSPHADRQPKPSVAILAQDAVDLENGAREVAFRLEALTTLADVLATTGAEIRRHATRLSEDFRELDRRLGGPR